MSLRQPLPALLSLLISTTVWAGPPMPFQPLQFGLESEPASVTDAAGRFEAATGMARALYRPDFRARPGTPEAMAREFLAARATQLYGPQREALRDTVLSLRSVQDFGAFSVVRLEQEAAGLPIHGTEVVVGVRPDGEILQVQQAVSARVAELVPVAGKTSLSARAAAVLAREYLRADAASVQFEDSRRMWWLPAGAAPHEVWRVLLVAGADAGEWELLVDVHSGAVVRAQNRDLHFDGNGKVFDPDPLSSAGVSYNTAGYVDGNDANTTQLQAQQFTRPLRDLTQAGGVWTLKGPWADCVDWDAPTGTCATSASGVFDYTRDDDNFESVNVYYHVDTYMRWVNETLGVSIRPQAYAGGVQYDPRGFSGDDNSSFTSSTDRLRFGEGGVDDAEDADVIIHELGHGLHDWVTNSGLSQVQGLSEGVGDYLASSYSRSFGHWQPAQTPYNWMFDWDGHNPFWSGRITNYHLSVTYQTLPSGLHIPGQYWASCNLLNYNSIGRVKADRAFFLGLALTGGSSNQQDSAQAVLNAAAAAGYSEADLQVMHANFSAGTTVPANRRCSYVVSLPAAPSMFRDGFEN